MTDLTAKHPRKLVPDIGDIGDIGDMPPSMPAYMPPSQTERLTLRARTATLSEPTIRESDDCFAKPQIDPTATDSVVGASLFVAVAVSGGRPI